MACLLHTVCYQRVVLSPAVPAPRCRTHCRQLTITAGAVRSENRTSWTTKTGKNDIAIREPSTIPGPSNAACNSAEEVAATVSKLQRTFSQIDAMISYNLRRVQQAYKCHKIGPHHFAGSTGYGHGDLGRAALDEVMADVMGAESAIVRIQFVSGTHAISTALSAVLRPGDELLAVAGKPYDTLEEVIGLRGTPGHGSLMEWGVTYRALPLDSVGTLDWKALETAIKPNTRVALIQRSCGYALRPTLTIAEIARAVRLIKAQQGASCLVLVDNCYGEFTEACEPPAVGADLCMGSLIKSPGGTIVSGGGYIAGKQPLVAAAAARLTAPGVGMDAGCVPGETLRLMFQGLFLAPQMVGEALKGGRLVAQVMANRGYKVLPPADCQSVRQHQSAAVRPTSAEAARQPMTDVHMSNATHADDNRVNALQSCGAPAVPESHTRTTGTLDGRSNSRAPPDLPNPSFITAVELGSREHMVAFCRAVQLCSPVGSYVTPVPGATPGYGDEVIFADGTFIDGSTAELSADGPLRPPFVVYCQGGTHWTHWAYVMECVLDALPNGDC